MQKGIFWVLKRNVKKKTNEASNGINFPTFVGSFLAKQFTHKKKSEIYFYGLKIFIYLRKCETLWYFFCRFFATKKKKNGKLNCWRKFNAPFKVIINLKDVIISYIFLAKEIIWGIFKRILFSWKIEVNSSENSVSNCSKNSFTEFHGSIQ